MDLASIPYRRRPSVFCECFVVLGESFFFFFFTLFSALLTYDWRKPHVSTARRHRARVRRPPPSGSPGRPAPRSYCFLLFPFLFFFSFFGGAVRAPRAHGPSEPQRSAGRRSAWPPCRAWGLPQLTLTEPGDQCCPVSPSTQALATPVLLFT